MKTLRTTHHRRSGFHPTIMASVLAVAFPAKSAIALDAGVLKAVTGDLTKLNMGDTAPRMPDVEPTFAGTNSVAAPATVHVDLKASSRSRQVTTDHALAGKEMSVPAQFCSTLSKADGMAYASGKAATDANAISVSTLDGKTCMRQAPADNLPATKPDYTRRHIDGQSLKAIISMAATGTVNFVNAVLGTSNGHYSATGLAAVSG